jgi:hypothetical protein
MTASSSAAAIARTLMISLSFTVRPYRGDALVRDLSRSRVVI